MPNISIIIPTHNRSRFLKMAIESALAQSYQDFEIVVVDDGSTDDTAKVVALFNEPKINYIYQEQAAVAAARNRGVAAAHGEYIVFLDDDDLLMPDFLAVSIAAIKANPEYAMTYGHSETINGDGNVIMVPPGVKVRSGYRFKDFMLKRINPPIQTWLLKKDAFEKLGGFDPKWEKSEDYDMVVRITFRHAIYGLERTLALRRVHDPLNMRSGLNNTYDIVATGQAHIKSIEGFFEEEPEAASKYWLLRRRALALWYNYTAFHLMKVGESSEARSYLREGLRYTPWSPRLLMKMLVVIISRGGDLSWYFAFRDKLKKVLGPKISVRLHRVLD